jgi:hypothetical protein
MKRKTSARTPIGGRGRLDVRMRTRARITREDTPRTNIRMHTPQADAAQHPQSIQVCATIALPCSNTHVLFFYGGFGSHASLSRHPPGRERLPTHTYNHTQRNIPGQSKDARQLRTRVRTPFLFFGYVDFFPHELEPEPSRDETPTYTHLQPDAAQHPQSIQVCATITLPCSNTHVHPTAHTRTPTPRALARTHARTHTPLHGPTPTRRKTLTHTYRHTYIQI